MNTAELEKILRAIEARLHTIERLLHIQSETPFYGLAPRHEKLLNFFLAREGRVVTKEALFTLMWPGLDRSDKLPEVLIHGLRKEIKANGLPFLITNQFNIGWTLTRTPIQEKESS